MGQKKVRKNKTCKYCYRTFALPLVYKSHLLSHTGEYPYECTDCGHKFKQKISLRNHIICMHKTGNEIKLYICNCCNKEFPLKERLKLHMRTHTGEKPYSCDLCDKTFARISQLSQHKKHHTKLRQYKCGMCETSYVSRHSLLDHIKRHINERNYECNICNKAFIRRDGWQKHMKQFHEQCKAFKCSICNKKYKGHLLQHMRIHLEDKPHKCSQCDMRFVQKSQLTVHLRRHSGIKPYRCQICHMAFAHSTALKMHMHRHTGEKPFKCLICPDRAFSQLPHLKKHMLAIHKTDKPYLCVGCNTFFKTKNLLLEHESNCETCVETKTEKNVIQLQQREVPLEKIRKLLAILLQKISTPSRLHQFGYGKRLIDDVLCESIKSSGRDPCVNENLDESERLLKNIDILLDWTIPKQYMEQFRKQNRKTEEILKDLTS